jgi:hypothetical protein
MGIQVITVVFAALSWIGVSLLAFFLWRIARFYEKSSGERAHSWLFTLPMVLLPFGAIYYLFSDIRFVGGPVGDSLLLAGGLTLLLASAMLQQIMMGER